MEVFTENTEELCSILKDYPFNNKSAIITAFFDVIWNFQTTMKIMQK
jgi:hypothetical protein